MFIGTDKVVKLLMIQARMVVVLVNFLTVITRNEKFIFDNHRNERAMQIISVGLLEFASDYSHPICSFCSNVSGYGSSHY
jgi:hypothetical protein